LPERVRLKVESAEEDIRVLEYRSQAAGARRKMKTSQRRFLGLRLDKFLGGLPNF
jgi:hypothetical protein